MDLYVYLQEGAASSSQPTASEFAGAARHSQLVWQENGLTFDWEDTNNRGKTVQLPVCQQLKQNGSAWAHVYLTKSGVSPDPKHLSYRPTDVVSVVHQLNAYRPARKQQYARSLLAAGNATEIELAKQKHTAEATANATVLENYWKPTLSLQLLDMTADFQRNHIAPVFADYIQFHNATGNYYPMVYVNEFWLQSKHFMSINSTVTELPLELSWGMIGLAKWQLMSQLQKQWSAQQSLGFADDGANDSVIEMLGETSPSLLVLTMVVSCLHAIFDMLAFKNDVAFWRGKKKSLEGLSVRSMMVNCFFQLVILLYLADNNTSKMILASSAIGLLIEFWKVSVLLLFTYRSTSYCFAYMMCTVSTV
jgi:Cleft lip and palate transmembrane protein 1 (CLPTM1)